MDKGQTNLPAILKQFGQHGRRYGPIAALAGIGFAALTIIPACIFRVDAGHRSVVFNRFWGVKSRVYGEGTHFKIPWLENPYIYLIRPTPTTMTTRTGSKDLQMVNISLRVLTKPEENRLPWMLSRLGQDYEKRVLPSIVKEVLASVVAQFNAPQLVTQIQDVSTLMSDRLESRAHEFGIEMTDVSITEMTFSPDFKHAVELKQIAQQDAEKARYMVERAQQDKRSAIIKAKGEAKSAEMIGEAIRTDPTFITLRKLEAAREISTILASSSNRVYLDSEALMMSVIREDADKTDEANW